MAKSKYGYWITEDGLTLLKGWARDGLTDVQIAHNMGIATATLYEWKKKHSDILEALKKGKEVVDYFVENALLKRALGYRTVEIIEELRENESGEMVMIEVKRVHKEVPPDTTAQIFWLKNRKRANWRDKPVEIDVFDNETGVIEIVPQLESKGEFNE